LSILLVFLSASCLGEKKRYDGYKVLRIDIEDDSQLQKIENLSEKLLADVWAINRQEGWVDVMVSPTQIRPFLRRFSSKVHIEDVQATLEEHYAEMANASLVGDVFDSFPTRGQAVTWVNEQIAAYPSLTSRVIVGKTYLGIDILGVKLALSATPKKNSLHPLYHSCT
jgi:hypothetical protein